jgi:hypothetical protein
MIRPFDLQVRDLRRQRILPRPGDLDQVIRYERHLTRELAQTLAELRHLKHARNSARPDRDSSSAADLTPSYREMPPRTLHYFPEGTNPDSDLAPSSEPDVAGLE